MLNSNTELPRAMSGGTTDLSRGRGNSDSPGKRRSRIRREPQHSLFFIGPLDVSLCLLAYCMIITSAHCGSCILKASPNYRKTALGTRSRQLAVAGDEEVEAIKT